MKNISKLTDAEKSIYKYMSENKDIFSLSIIDIAEKTFTSKATVSRFINKMGFKNLIELKTFFFNFKKEKNHGFIFPTYEKIYKLKKDNSEKIFNKINDFDIDEEIISITKLIKLIKISENIIICGQGTSKLPGIALENFFSRSNKNAVFYSDYEISKQKIINLNKNSLVILFSVSGESNIHKKLLKLDSQSEAKFASISSSYSKNDNIVSIYLPKIDTSYKLKNNIIQLFFIDLISSLL